MEKKRLKSQLQTNDYRRAWVEYNRRWYAAWVIPLALVLVALLTFNSRALGWMLMAAVLAYGFLYVRFVRWPCPRCGEGFTMPTVRGVFRAEKCTYCRLERNAIPDSAMQTDSPERSANAKGM